VTWKNLALLLMLKRVACNSIGMALDVRLLVCAQHTNLQIRTGDLSGVSKVERERKRGKKERKKERKRARVRERQREAGRGRESGREGEEEPKDVGEWGEHSE
jgi:hypothetical protein